MLNISPNTVRAYIDPNKFSSLYRVESRKSGRAILRILYGIAILVPIILFLPWTQNIQAGGSLTTIKPGQRPQTIHATIPGRIEKWYVQEGDLVEKGDTIIFLSEVKDEYFDPQLLARTEQQMRAKEQSAASYAGKVDAVGDQIEAMLQTAELKLEQAKNYYEQARFKVTTDSVDLQAAVINHQVAKEQYERMQTLYTDGLRSLTDLESRELTLQRTQAALISAENRLLASKNQRLNAELEIISIQAQYRDAIAKAESEQFTARSGQFDAEATVTKLQNQYSNYSVRSGFYYVTAPQTGYITKAVQAGIGETVKEGQQIVSVMPSTYDLAVEMYVKPIDLPLLEFGQEVMIQFDGWPAIVFSGWPNTSYGTYTGEIFAIDNFISENGMYRALIRHAPGTPAWPGALRFGSGARNMVLLKDVPIWYEMWRQLNGFPPDYYKQNTVVPKK